MIQTPAGPRANTASRTSVPFVSSRLASYSTTDLTLGYRFGDPRPIHNRIRA